MALRTYLTPITDLFKAKTKPDSFPDKPLAEFSFGELVKSWPDPSYKVSREAYETLNRADAVMQPMQKFARRIGSMKLEVVGSGKLRDELQRIVDQTVGISDGLEWLAYAEIEGLRFLWNRADFDEEQDIYVADFRGCGRQKWKAGGTFLWTGWEDNRVLKMREYPTTTAPSEVEAAKEKELDRKQVVVFRPGAGDNPEGDPNKTFQYFLIAEMARLLDKSMAVYQERYSLPREMLKKMLDSLRPDEQQVALSRAVSKMAQSNARGRMAVNAEDAIDLLEPSGATWQFLIQYRRLLEARAHKLITGENLTSDSSGSGDSGSSDLSEKQLNSAAVAFGKKIADALTMDWLPWLMQINAHALPKLKKSEPKPYLVLRAPIEKQRITVQEFLAALEKDIEVTTDEMYEILTLTRPEGVPDTYKMSRDSKAQQGPEGMMPSPEGGAEQRPDRQKDPGNPDENPEMNKPQDSNRDDRNMGKEEQEK